MKYLFCVGVFVNVMVGILCPVPPHPPGHNRVSCYYCQGWRDVPSCLNQAYSCRDDEVCHVKYGSQGVTVGCKKERECQHGFLLGASSCGTWGYQTTGSCEKCCSDDTCVYAEVLMLKKSLATTQQPAQTPIPCPSRCLYYMCSPNSYQCSPGQFCEITAEHEQMTGRCVSNNEYTRCSFDNRRNDAVCGWNNLALVQGPKRCVYCCQDSSCSLSHFTIKTTPKPTTMSTVATTTTKSTTTSPTKSTKPKTTTRQTTKTTATTTITTTQLPNPLLYGKCKNLLELNGCDPINTTVCSTDLGVRVCADSCGLCSLIKSRFTNNIICADHLISNECQVLQKTQDICNHNLAMFTCPKSCNICDSVLNTLIKEVLTKTTSNMLTSTVTPTPSAAPTTTTTPSAAPSTSKRLHIVRLTQVITQQPQVTTTSCVDKLQGMKCVDLKDVCKNFLAHQICQKFCGFCGTTGATVPTTSSASP